MPPLPRGLESAQPPPPAATAEFLGGKLLVQGKVIENTVRYGGGFDLGKMIVRGVGGEAVLPS